MTDKATVSKILADLGKHAEDNMRIAVLERAARSKFEAGAATNNVQMIEDARNELHVLLDQTMDLIVSIEKFKSDSLKSLR